MQAVKTSLMRVRIFADLAKEIRSSGLQAY